MASNDKGLEEIPDGMLYPFASYRPCVGVVARIFFSSAVYIGRRDEKSCRHAPPPATTRVKAQNMLTIFFLNYSSDRVQLR
ncbi:hypothetical protein BJX65DRAFT_264564 [Aspergillus insuetus]